jgi:hypothetical protein
VLFRSTEELGGGPSFAKQVSPQQIYKSPVMARDFQNGISEVYLKVIGNNLPLTGAVEQMRAGVTKLVNGGFGGIPNQIANDPHKTQVGGVADLTAICPSATTASACAALMARKAIEMFSQIAEQNTPRAGKPIDKRVFKFTDGVDKIQIIYPYQAGCLNSLKDINEVNGKLKPDAQNALQKGSMRFMIWNKRTACTCPYKSVYRDGSKIDGKQKPKSWGCQPWRGIEKSNYSVGDGDGQ